MRKKDKKKKKKKKCTCRAWWVPYSKVPQLQRHQLEPSMPSLWRCRSSTSSSLALPIRTWGRLLLNQSIALCRICSSTRLVSWLNLGVSPHDVKKKSAKLIFSPWCQAMLTSRFCLLTVQAGTITHIQRHSSNSRVAAATSESHWYLNAIPQYPLHDTLT
jgi:hypothetical protein